MPWARRSPWRRRRRADLAGRAVSPPARMPTRGSTRAGRAAHPSLASIVRAGPRRRCFRSGALFGVLHRASLANDRDFHLTGVLQRVLDLLRDVSGEARGLKIVELLGLDDNADLATRLDRERFLDAGEAVGDARELLQTLDGIRDDLAASAGSRRADGVGGRDEGADHRHRLHVAVMADDAVDDRLRKAVPLEELAADHGVRALDLVVDRLADVVE